MVCQGMSQHILRGLSFSMIMVNGMFEFVMKEPKWQPVSKIRLQIGGTGRTGVKATLLRNSNDPKLPIKRCAVHIRTPPPQAQHRPFTFQAKSRKHFSI